MAGYEPTVFEALGEIENTDIEDFDWDQGNFASHNSSSSENPRFITGQLQIQAPQSLPPPSPPAAEENAGSNAPLQSPPFPPPAEEDDGSMAPPPPPPSPPPAEENDGGLVATATQSFPAGQSDNDHMEMCDPHSEAQALLNAAVPSDVRGDENWGGIGETALDDIRGTDIKEPKGHFLDRTDPRGSTDRPFDQELAAFLNGKRPRNDFDPREQDSELSLPPSKAPRSDVQAEMGQAPSFPGASELAQVLSPAAGGAVPPNSGPRNAAGKAPRGGSSISAPLSPALNNYHVEQAIEQVKNLNATKTAPAGGKKDGKQARQPAPKCAHFRRKDVCPDCSPDNFCWEPKHAPECKKSKEKPRRKQACRECTGSMFCDVEQHRAVRMSLGESAQQKVYKRNCTPCKREIEARNSRSGHKYGVHCFHHAHAKYRKGACTLTKEECPGCLGQ